MVTYLEQSWMPFHYIFFNIIWKSNIIFDSHILLLFVGHWVIALNKLILFRKFDVVLFFIHYTLYSINVRYTVYYIRYIVYSVRYTLYNIRYTVYNVRFPVYNIRYTVYNVLYTVYNVLYTLYSRMDTRSRDTVKNITSSS